MGRHVDRYSNSQTLNSGVWKHVVFTGGLESGNIITKIYVNGQLIISQNEGNYILPDLTYIYLVP